MKKILSFLFLFICIFTLASCDKEPPVVEVTFEIDGKTTADVGEEVSYSVKNVKNAGDNYTVAWDSSNKTVATIDNQGKATCLAAGETTISATISEKKVEVKLTVSEVVVNILSVEDLNVEAIMIFDEYSTSDNYQLKLTMVGSESTDTLDVIYNSADAAVTSLMMVYKTDDVETNHLYTKDGKSYMYDGTNKTYTTLIEGEAERQAISCSFTTITTAIGFLEEAEFYSSLQEGELDENGYAVYQLDMESYQGNTINLKDKTSVELKVKLNETVKYFELVIVEAGKTLSVKLELTGTAAKEITYPTDFASYVEAKLGE